MVGSFAFPGREESTMKRLVGSLAVLLLAAFAVGCGGETGKNVNKDKDKPKPAENGPP
jgi:hypothetical protein